MLRVDRPLTRSPRATRLGDRETGRAWPLQPDWRRSFLSPVGAFCPLSAPNAFLKRPLGCLSGASTAQEEGADPPGLGPCLIPGLPDDVALLCLARVGAADHRACRGVSVLWRQTLGGSSFYQKRKELGLEEPVLILRVARKTTQSYEWYAVYTQAPETKVECAAPRARGRTAPLDVQSTAGAGHRRGMPGVSQDGLIIGSAPAELGQGCKEPLRSLGNDKASEEQREAGFRSQDPDGTLTWRPSTPDASAASVPPPAAMPRALAPDREEKTSHRHQRLPRPSVADSFRMGGVGAVCSNGQLYILGGMLGNRGACKAVFRFDVPTGRWAKAEEMKTGRAHFGCWVLENGDIMVAGGMTDDSRELSSSEIFNVGKEQWSMGPQLPSDIVKFDAAKLAGKLLLSEGWHWPFHFSPRGFEISLKGTQWGLTSEGLCQGWTGPSAVVHDKLLSLADKEPGYHHLQVYDASTDSWQAVRDSRLPQLMSPPWAIAAWGDRLYVVGKGGLWSVGLVGVDSGGVPHVSWTGASALLGMEDATPYLCQVLWV